MSAVSKSRLLRVSQNEVDEIRRSLRLQDEASIRRDVDMVVEWYEKQQHLPRILLDRDFVERLLICRKGSVEQTKQRIDLIYTLRTLVPDMAAPRDILHPAIQRQFLSLVYAPMPKLNHDLTRIQIYKPTPNAELFNIADTIKYILMVIDFRLKYDYARGERFIFDFQHLSLAHVSGFMNPIAFKQADLFLRGYGTRMAGFHYINAPPFIQTIMNVIKGTMSAKLTDRIVVHTSLDQLHKVISKKILPKEYGGEEETLEVHAENWKQELSKEENRQYLMKQESLKSNEALRLEPRPPDNMLGIPGSFKTINVD